MSFCFPWSHNFLGCLLSFLCSHHQSQWKNFDSFNLFSKCPDTSGVLLTSSHGNISLRVFYSPLVWSGLPGQGWLPGISVPSPLLYCIPCFLCLPCVSFLVCSLNFGGIYSTAVSWGKKAYEVYSFETVYLKISLFYLTDSLVRYKILNQKSFAFRMSKDCLYFPSTFL